MNDNNETDINIDDISLEGLYALNTAFKLISFTDENNPNNN